MTKKAVRHARSRRRKWPYVFAIVVAAVLISVLMYTNSYPKPPKDSSKYFVISDLAGIYRPLAGGNITIAITDFAFNFTAVGGDAHNLVIFTAGMSDPLEHTFQYVPNGTSTFSGEILPQFGIQSRLTAGQYPMNITINCDEAMGDITLIFIPGENLYSLGPG
jgi:hypothetical protein